MFTVKKKCNLNEWCHLALTWSSVDGNMLGYINGTLELSVNVAESKDTPIVNTEEGKLVIGMVSSTHLKLGEKL